MTSAGAVRTMTRVPEPIETCGNVKFETHQRCAREAFGARLRGEMTSADEHSELRSRCPTGRNGQRTLPSRCGADQLRIIDIANCHKSLLIRTSSRIAPMARDWVTRPLSDRPLMPPRITFS